jgi:rRNA maturation endonuclease Nob1
MGNPEKFVKKCIKCSEVMPTYEKVCACGGSIMIELVDLETYEKARGYHRRVWLKKMREE